MPDPGDGTDPKGKTPDGDGDDTTKKPETGADGKPFDAARAQQTIDNLRQIEKDAKARETDLAKKLADAEKLLKGHDDAKLSNEEKLAEGAKALEADNATKAARVAELEQQLQDERLRNAVQLEAAKQGAIDPDDVYQLLDRAAVKFDEDGKPEGVEDAVKELIKRKPHLAKTAGGGQTLPIPGTPKPPAPKGEDTDADKAAQAANARSYGTRF